MYVVYIPFMCCVLCIQGGTTQLHGYHVQSNIRRLFAEGPHTRLPGRWRVGGICSTLIGGVGEFVENF